MIRHRYYENWINKFKPGTRFKYKVYEDDFEFRIFTVTGKDIQPTERKSRDYKIVTEYGIECTTVVYEDNDYKTVYDRMNNDTIPILSLRDNFPQNQIIFVEDDNT